MAAPARMACKKGEAVQGGARAGTARLRGRALGPPGGGVTWQEEAPLGEPGVGGRGGGTGRAPRRLADGVVRVRTAKVAQVPRWRR